MLSLNSKKFPNTVNPFLMKLISYTAIIFISQSKLLLLYFCQVLSHSWEWIRRNKNTGLMALSEEALEPKQKSARNIRKFRCYQGDVVKNLSQAHRTMQLESDMFLNKPYESRNYNVSIPCNYIL